MPRHWTRDGRSGGLWLTGRPFSFVPSAGKALTARCAKNYGTARNCEEFTTDKGAKNAKANLPVTLFSVISVLSVAPW